MRENAQKKLQKMVAEALEICNKPIWEFFKLPLKTAQKTMHGVVVSIPHLGEKPRTLRFAWNMK